MVLGAILLGMLWVVGAPMRLFGLSISVLGVAAVALAAIDPERLQRITHFTDPFKDYTDAGWQPAHGLYALSSGGWFGQGIGASTQKWGDLPGGPHRLHLRRARRGARPGRHAARGRPVLHDRLRRDPGRAQHRGPVRPLRDLRHRGLAARPDDDQRRHGARRPAGHRHPAPDRVLRRVGPAALARGPRAGDRLRAPRAGGRCRARRTPTQPLRRTLRGSRSRRFALDARTSRRRRLRRPHLAPARHRRRPAPARPGDRGHLPRHPRGARVTPRPRGRAAARDRAARPAPASSRPRPAAYADPVARRARGRARGGGPGASRRRRRLRRLRLRPRLPRRPQARRADRGPRGQRDPRHRQQAGRPHDDPRRHELPRHRPAAARCARACRSAG